MLITSAKEFIFFGCLCLCACTLRPRY